LAPLDGLRVVDLSPTRVGAQVTQPLADFGADVVWIEPPGGSALRAQPSFPFLARGKRSVVLDLKQEGDAGRARRLAAEADVVVETFRPGVAERLGLGYDDLRLGNPGLVYASITGFGRLGPYAGVKAYEGLVMAKLGVNATFSRMHKGPHPPFVSVPWCSFAASQTALHGVLAALIDRERTGAGQRVEANLTQGYATLDTWEWFQRLIAERWPDAYTAVDTFTDKGVPNSPLTYMLLVALTRDGRWLQFAQVAPHLFAAFMRELGLDWMFGDPEWKGLPAFEDEDRRLALWTSMLQAAGSKTLAEWEAVFDSDPDVFAELFRSGPEVLAHPQLVADGHVVEVVDPERGPVLQPGPLVVMDATPAGRPRPAPTLGDCNPDSWSASDLRHPGVVDDPAPALPLDGVTILELAMMYAAPYGATLLTDLGARVIKVEALAGDRIRTILPFPESGGVKVMQGKESICIDITLPEGVDIVQRLAARCDVVLQGFRAGAADRHGLDAETLRALNPDLVYLSAPGYGQGPPNGHRPAFAPSIGAAGGIARANVGDTVPERPGLTMEEIREGAIRLSGSATVTSAQADGFAALGVATALLLGLLARARGAGGQKLEGSMLLTASHAMADHVVDFVGNPGPPNPGRDLRGPHARYRIYDAIDGWVFLAAPQEREWEPLADALAAHVDLRRDARFATEADRLANDQALTDALAAVFATGSKASWERELLAADVGCVAVTMETTEELLMSDGFGRASGYVVDVEHPTFDRHPRLAPVVRFSRSTTQAKPGVLAGSATDAVLDELGFSAAEIADLRARQVVR